MIETLKKAKRLLDRAIEAVDNSAATAIELAAVAQAAAQVAMAEETSKIASAQNATWFYIISRDGQNSVRWAKAATEALGKLGIDFSQVDYPEP